MSGNRVTEAIRFKVITPARPRMVGNDPRTQSRSWRRLETVVDLNEKKIGKVGS